MALGYDFCVDFDQATDWMTYEWGIEDEVTAKVGTTALLFLCASY